MRRLLILPLLLCAVPAAYAQTYEAHPNYPAPAPQSAPQQVSDNTRVMAPVYEPQDYVAQPRPQAPHPSDYGQSVMTDIRQMNF